MPLATLFIGGVLPAQLGSLIRKRAGYMKKNKKRIRLQALKPSSGWARPIYINRHPQPPSKYIGLSGFCQEVYLHKSKINLLQAPGIWDILGYYQLLTKGPYENRPKKRPGQILQ